MAKQVPARNGGTLTRPDKGETMNPNGRPKDSISLKTILNKILDGEITIEDAGQRRKITRREMMLLKVANDAVNDEDPAIRLRALQFIVDRTEGKAVETVKQNVSFSQPETMTDAQVEAITKAMTEK